MWLAGVTAAIVSLFAVSVALHGALFDRRPDPAHLTGFYLFLSVGGVIGGILGALVAPIIFDWTYEHPLLMIAAALAIPATSPFRRFVDLWNGSEAAHRATRWGIPLILLISLIGHGPFGLPASRQLASLATCLLSAIGVVAIGNRMLFAVGRRRADALHGRMEEARPVGQPRERCRAASSASIRSGHARRARRRSCSTARPSTAFSCRARRSAGAARRLLFWRRRVSAGAPPRRPCSASVPALASSASAPARSPAMRRLGSAGPFTRSIPSGRIARDPQRLPSCALPPGVPVLVGDARLTLEQTRRRRRWMLLVVDAFSSDSIPMHLLTLEAFGTYRRKLSADGLLMVHISNRHLDLKPVVAAAARARVDGAGAPISPDRRGHCQQPAHPVDVGSDVAIAGDDRRLEAANPGGWRGLIARPGFKAVDRRLCQRAAGPSRFPALGRQGLNAAA